MSRAFGKSSAAGCTHPWCGKTSGAAARAASTARRPFSSTACGTTTRGSWSRCWRRSSRLPLHADRAGIARRVRSESREGRGQVSRAEVSRQELGEQVTEIGGHGYVPAFEALCRIEPGPLTPHLPAVYRATAHQHGGRGPAIGAPVPVLPPGTPALGHREHHHAAHPLAPASREG